MDDQTRLQASPLKRLKNLKEVDPSKVAQLEKRLKQTYVAGMAEYAREARLRAEQVRDKVLY